MSDDFSERAKVHQDVASKILVLMTDNNYSEADALTLLVGLTGKILSMSHGEQLEEKVETTCQAIKVCTSLYKDIYKTLKELSDGDT
jgi:hypothetical protein